ncbi:MAG TPA: hypothetical protein PKA63_06795 [Oligoflexia bacterium]|nr:hypothetical protein [Oligoflexia bacterium]HMP48357.1 hypothetical protein [Oligoflexia bacterium]
MKSYKEIFMTSRMHIALSAALFFCTLGTSNASDNSDITCSANEVKVCFSDGACTCTVRQIPLSDKTPVINECLDIEDSGACDN